MELTIRETLPSDVHEGRGIGSNLLARVVEWLRSAGFSTLWLAASPDAGTRAYGFYRSLGWRPNGEIDENGDEILVLPSDDKDRLSRHLIGWCIKPR